MNAKVRRGLGLLVVAALAWVLQQAVVGHTLPPVLEAALLAVAVACLLGGLVLLAWGLLTD